MREKYPHRNIVIEDFIPFGAIMPRASVYVTNGGYGGVILSIKHELPMVVAGVHEGKNEINARIGYFGIGLNLQTETPTPEQLRNGVETVLQDPEYGRRIRALNAEFATYHAEKLCERYVEEALADRRK
jgi:UDP:flavonoid glycosyltransferase YjiC (YdhE family)